MHKLALESECSGVGGWGVGGGGVGGGLPRLWQKQKLYESMSAEKRHVWTSINASKARPNDCLPVGASD